MVAVFCRAVIAKTPLSIIQNDDVFRLAIGEDYIHVAVAVNIDSGDVERVAGSADSCPGVEAAVPQAMEQDGAWVISNDQIGAECMVDIRDRDGGRSCEAVESEGRAEEGAEKGWAW